MEYYAATKKEQEHLFWTDTESGCIIKWKKQDTEECADIPYFSKVYFMPFAFTEDLH